MIVIIIIISQDAKMYSFPLFVKRNLSSTMHDSTESSISNKQKNVLIWKILFKIKIADFVHDFGYPLIVEPFKH